MIRPIIIKAFLLSVVFFVHVLIILYTYIPSNEDFGFISSRLFKINNFLYE